MKLRDFPNNALTGSDLAIVAIIHLFTIINHLDPSKQWNL